VTKVTLFVFKKMSGGDKKIQTDFLLGALNHVGKKNPLLWINSNPIDPSESTFKTELIKEYGLLPDKSLAGQKKWIKDKII